MKAKGLGEIWTWREKNKKNRKNWIGIAEMLLGRGKILTIAFCSGLYKKFS